VEHSVNVQSAFSQRSVSIQSAFSQRSVNIQRTTASASAGTGPSIPPGCGRVLELRHREAVWPSGGGGRRRKVERKVEYNNSAVLYSTREQYSRQT
jgi:hypothetical protein